MCKVILIPRSCKACKPVLLLAQEVQLAEDNLDPTDHGNDSEWKRAGERSICQDIFF